MNVKILDKYVGNDILVKVPEGITCIGPYAFNQNKTVKTILLPSTLKYIQYNSFEDCTSLENITIPSSRVILTFCFSHSKHRHSHIILLFVFRLVILARGDAIELLEEGGEGGGA